MESALFSTVPSRDALEFGYGDDFDAKRVADWFDLDKQSVSRISSVAKASVRYDDSIPRAVKERLEEIASIANMVAIVFEGDRDKTALWFRTKNPLLGDVSPRDMIRLGRYGRLRKFIINAMADRPLNSKS